MRLIYDFRRDRITGSFFILLTLFNLSLIFSIIEINKIGSLINNFGIKTTSNFAIFSLSLLGLIASYLLNIKLKLLRENQIKLAEKIGLNESIT